MNRSLFRSSLRPRLLAAAAYASLAFGAVAIATAPRRSADEPAGAPPSVPGERTARAPEATDASAAVRLRLELHSVRPVASWLVRLGDRELTPASATAEAWMAEFELPRETANPLLSILAFSAEAETAAATPPANALELRLIAPDTGRTLARRALWCEAGECVHEFPLREILP